jgi:dipeptide/tripeptide permease
MRFVKFITKLRLHLMEQTKSLARVIIWVKLMFFFMQKNKNLDVINVFRKKNINHEFKISCILNNVFFKY